MLPAALAVPRGAEGRLAVLENISSDAPQLVVTTSSGELRFEGKYVPTSSTVFTINCQPRKRQSVCSDVFDRVLVFDKPAFTPFKAASSSERESADNNYSLHHGLSDLADPLKKTTVTNRLRLVGRREGDEVDTISTSDESDVYRIDADDALVLSSSQASLSRERRKSADKVVKYNVDDSDGDFDEEDYSATPKQKSGNKKSGSSVGNKKGSGSSSKHVITLVDSSDDDDDGNEDDDNEDDDEYDSDESGTKKKLKKKVWSISSKSTGGSGKSAHQATKPAPKPVAKSAAKPAAKSGAKSSAITSASKSRGASKKRKLGSDSDSDDVDDGDNEDSDVVDLTSRSGSRLSARATKRSVNYAMDLAESDEEWDG